MHGLASVLLLLAPASELPGRIHLELPTLVAPSFGEEPDFRPDAPRWSTLREKARQEVPRWMRWTAAGLLEPVLGLGATGVGLVVAAVPFTVVLAISLGLYLNHEGPITPGWYWEEILTVVVLGPFFVLPGLATGAAVHLVSEKVGGLAASRWASIAGGVAGNVAMTTLALVLDRPHRALLLLPSAGAIVGCNASIPFVDHDPMELPISPPSKEELFGDREEASLPDLSLPILSGRF